MKRAIQKMLLSGYKPASAPPSTAGTPAKDRGTPGSPRVSLSQSVASFNHTPYVGLDACADFTGFRPLHAVIAIGLDDSELWPTLHV